MKYTEYLKDLEQEKITLLERGGVSGNKEIHTWLIDGGQKDVLVVFSPEDPGEVVEVKTERKTDDGELWYYI